MTLFLDSLGEPYLYPDYVYLFLISFPTYTYLLCGLFYQLLVLKVMLQTRKTLAQMQNQSEEDQVQRKSNIRREETRSCVTHLFIYLLMVGLAVTFVVDYWQSVGYAVNNTNRIFILGWYIIVFLFLAVSSYCWLTEMKKHATAEFLRVTRIRVSENAVANLYFYI